MTDASNPPAEDLEAQLEALMKQARQGGSAPDADNQAAAESPAAETVAVEDKPPAEEEPVDLASQLDALMAKVGDDEPDSPDTETPETEVSQQEEEKAAPVGTDVIADGPPDVEDALDQLEGAFEAVQDVIEELDKAPAAPQGQLTPEVESDSESESNGDDLADQLQSLLDEASAAETESLASPEEILGKDATDEPEPQEEVEDDDELDGDFNATVEDVIAEAAAAENASSSPTTAEPTADDPPLIDQIDSLLADHADDALSGDFESVDDLLGVRDTAAENAADLTDDLDESDDDDDDLGGDFQSMDDLLAKPEAADPDETPAEAEPVMMPPAEPRREEPAMELDEIDGLFDAPAPPPNPPSQTAASPNAPDGDEANSGFESLDALFSAPPPSAEDRDGAPPSAKPKAKSKTKKSPAESWSITLNLAALQAVATLLLGWTLWACAMANKPLDKLPAEIKQTVGWVALAIAGPGVLLVVYGLLFN